MQTHVYFNVAKNGLHLFRTDWYSMLDRQELVRQELIRAFLREMDTLSNNTLGMSQWKEWMWITNGR